MLASRFLKISSVVALCIELQSFLPAAAQMDEIVVTARKRAESLQDVPLSISAFDLEGLRQRNIQNVYDVATFSPNFDISRNLGRRLDAPTVRGQNSPLLGQSNASFYIDGVFVSGSSGSITVDNLERVEILRGPQAALFGRATFAGAINFITRKPTNEFEGEVNLKAGTHEDYKASTWVSGPIVEDKLFFFASASWEHFGGEWHNNLQPGEVTSFVTSWLEDAPMRGDTSSLGGEETIDFTGKLTIQPTDNLEVNLKATYTEADDEHFASLRHSASLNNCFEGRWFCGELDPDGLTSAFNIPLMEDGISTDVGDAAPAEFIGARSRIHRYLGEVIYDLQDWELVGRATYNTIDDQYVRDLDRDAFSLAGLFESDSIFRTSDTSYEARIASPDDWRLRGLVGAYYFESKSKNVARNFPFPRPDLTTTSLTRVENRALFGSIDFDILDNLTFTYDWRYAEDTLTQEVTAEDALADPDIPNFARETFYSVTPRYTLSYRPNDDVNIYGLAAKGNKPGGFNFAFFDSDVVPSEITAALADGRAIIEEEEAWTYELGVKTSGWFDDRLSLNTAVYYIDWTNQAINEAIDIQTVSGPESNSVVTNAGKSQVFGIEIESMLNLTDNLSLALNYGMADTELLEFNSEDIELATGEAPPDISTGGNAKGKEAPRVPKHNANFSATYRDNLANADWEWYVRSDLVYESKKWQSPVNAAYVGDLYLWNARFGLDSEQWSVSLYVDNILDDDTPTLAQTFPDFRYDSSLDMFQLTPRRGTNTGVTAQFRF